MIKTTIRFLLRTNIYFFVLVVFSLTISAASSVYLFSLRINNEIKPRVLNSLKVTEAQLASIKDKSIIYSDVFNENKTINSFLKGEVGRGTLLDELIKLSGRTDFDILHILDSRGTIVARMEKPDRFGESLEDDPLVQNTLRDRRSADFNFVDGKLSIVASFPIKENGKILGALITGYYLDGRLLEYFKSFIGMDLTIFKEEKILASTFVNPDLKINDGRLMKIVQDVSQKNSPIGRFDYSGKQYLSGFSQIKSENGTLIATLISSLDLEAANNANGRTLASIFLTASLTLLLAYLLSVKLSKRLTQPLYAIKDGARIIGGGDLNYQIKLSTGDEFEDLASDFNKMARGLKESIKNIEQNRDEIAAEKNLLSSILSGIIDGVIALDQKRRVILFSDGAQRLTGLAPTDVLGKDINKVLKFFRLPDEPIEVREFCPAGEFLSEDTVLFKEGGIFVKISKNKKELYADVMSATIKESRVINLGCIITLHDVTAEHELEQMKLDFVSMAAHELRTPLTSIAGYLYFLREELGNNLTLDQKMYLERVGIGTKQLQTMIENLLNITKIEEGSLKLELKEEEWPALVREVCLNYKDFALQKNIEFTVAPVHEDLPKVFVDKFRISEVVSNLVSNAINFTQKNGRIIVRTYRLNNEMITEVSDNGPGIPKEALPKLFTKFYRVSGILSEGSKGTGLGLYISKSIVNLHQGRIWVQSRVGTGSSFYFSLPISRSDPNEVK